MLLVLGNGRRAIDSHAVGRLGVGYQLYLDTLRNELSTSCFLLRKETRYYNGLHRRVLRHSLRFKG